MGAFIGIPAAMHDVSWSALLQSYRRKGKLKQKEAADKLQIPVRTLERWETGNSGPAGARAKRLLPLLLADMPKLIIESAERAYDRMSDEERAKKEAEIDKRLTDEHRDLLARLKEQYARKTLPWQRHLAARREKRLEVIQFLQDKARTLKRREKALKEREKQLDARECAIAKRELCAVTAVPI